MTKNIAGKDINKSKVIITGVNKNIGMAALVQFLKLGAEVLFSTDNEKDIPLIQNELRGHGMNAYGLDADIRTVEGRNKIFAWVSRNWAQLDILINSESMDQGDPPNSKQVSGQQGRTGFTTLSPFELSRNLLPFLEKGRLASVINIAPAFSISLRDGFPFSDLSEAGLIQMTRNLATEWASKKIRVNSIFPWVQVPAGSGKSRAGVQKKIFQPQLFSGVKPVHAQKIATVLAYLVLDKSAFVTGQSIIVDGKMSIVAV